MLPSLNIQGVVWIFIVVVDDFCWKLVNVLFGNEVAVVATILVERPEKVETDQQRKNADAFGGTYSL